MDHSKAPLLDALADYHQQNRYGFSPPGHRQGRGADERVLAVLGRDPFRADVVASGGLDDWRSSGQYLKQAEELMANAVGTPRSTAGDGRWCNMATNCLVLH
jgi:arginine decarboxylase